MKERWISDEHWRRDSQQTRGEKTQSALLDAAEELIVEKGLDQTSIADIAKRAGSSVGSVYHHFKDKKALFYAVYHRMTQGLIEQNKHAANAAHWKDAGVMDLFAGYLDLRSRQINAPEHSVRAAAMLMAHDQELKHHMAEIKLEGNKMLRELVLARRTEITHPDPETAVDFAIDQLAAMIYARTDPYQKISALSACDDATFKRMALVFVRSLLFPGQSD